MFSRRKSKWVETRSCCIWTKTRSIGRWWVSRLRAHTIYSYIYWLSLLAAFLIHVSSVIIAFVTIAVFLCIESNDDETTKFTTSRLFAALALFNQLTVPLFIFPITIPIIISAIVSTRRLEQFLRQPEVRKEFEGIRKIARVMSRSEASLDVFEIDDGDVGQIMTDYPNSPDHLSDVTFNIGFESNTNGDYFNQEPMSNDNNGNNNKSEFTKRRQTGNSSIKLKKNNQLSIRSKMDRNRQGRQKSLTSNEIQPELSNDLVVSVRNAVFSWDSCGLDFGLRIDRLDIPRGEGFFLFSFFSDKTYICVWQWLCQTRLHLLSENYSFAHNSRYIDWQRTSQMSFHFSIIDGSFACIQIWIQILPIQWIDNNIACFDATASGVMISMRTHTHTHILI